MNEQQEKLITDISLLSFDIKDQINVTERECLLKILWRYSLLKSVLTDFNKIVRVDFDDRKNYWEYYYPINDDGTLKYFLMSRELTVNVIDGVPDIKLQIDYNTNLVTNNEL